MRTKRAWALVLVLTAAALPARAAPDDDDDGKVPLAAAAAGGGLVGSGLGAVGGFVAALVAIENEASLTELIPAVAPIGAPIVDAWGPVAIGMVVGAVVGAGVAGVLVGVPVSPAPLTAGAGAVGGGALLATPGVCCGAALLNLDAEPGPCTTEPCLIVYAGSIFAAVVAGQCFGSLLGAAAGGAAGGAMVPAQPDPAPREVPPPEPEPADDVTKAPAPAPPAPRR